VGLPAGRSVIGPMGTVARPEREEWWAILDSNQ
jgi:hypothetical protein